MGTFGLTEDLEKVLSSKTGGLSSKKINPHNLDSIEYGEGFVLPKDFLSFDEDSANQEIDKATELTQSFYQGSRVLEAYQRLADAQIDYDRKMKSLVEKIAKCEIGREEGYARLQTLRHEAQQARRKAGLQHAADAESINLGFSKFEQGLKERLHRDGDTSRGGTMRGSSKNRRTAPELSIA